MKSTGTLVMALGLLLAAAVPAQIVPPSGKRSGPGVQSAADEREPEVLKACKTPPPSRAGGPRRGGARAQESGPRAYTVTGIPGVIAAGAQWKEVWQVDGNNADGIIATKDGGLLIAQNDNSDVIKLDKDGKTSVAFSGTNTGGSMATNTKGAIFVANRGLNPSIEQLVPARKALANRYNDDPWDCIGGVLNDIAADSKGGVYFTMGGLFHADAKGKVARYGENLTTNGIVLSADEKHLWVTNGQSLAVFDVQKDGSLTNQREFAKLGGNGDGSTFDSQGRLYVTTTAPGVQVISSEGKDLGTIPTPRGVISVAFSGPDRKTLYAVARDNAQNKDWIIAIPMMAQGPKGRGK
jgi:gluconolactonase